jgi:hypothetical protein
MTGAILLLLLKENEPSVSPAPTPIGNDCQGVNADGSPNIQFKCQVSTDADGTPIFGCVSMQLFFVSCNTTNSLCNSKSSAFLPAITVCTQRLFTNAQNG